MSPRRSYERIEHIGAAEVAKSAKLKRKTILNSRTYGPAYLRIWHLLPENCVCHYLDMVVNRFCFQPSRRRQILFTAPGPVNIFCLRPLTP